MLEEEKVVTSQEEVSKEENQVSETTTQEAPSTSQQRRPLKRSIRNRARSNDREKKEFEERVVSINRVSKTVKGGRRMKFSALVVVGDGKGRYGFGTGKAGEVPDAIKKALEAAKKNLHTIHITKTGTLTHEVVGKYGACKVFLKSAPEGTGIIAGGPVRAILELAGVRNVCSKVYGSRAPINIIRATHEGLQSLHTYSDVIALRGNKE